MSSDKKLPMDFEIEIITEDEVESSRSSRAKLPGWIPILSWGTPDLPDRFWNDRDYGHFTKEELEEIAEENAENLSAQHEYIDRELEIWGIRKRHVLEIRNQKEVRVRL